MTVAYSYLQNGRLRCQEGFSSFFKLRGGGIENGEIVDKSLSSHTLQLLYHYNSI